MGTQTNKKQLTVREAAEEFGLSPHTIRSWIAQRRLGHVRLGRAIRVPEHEVRRMLQAGTVPPLTGSHRSNHDY